MTRSLNKSEEGRVWLSSDLLPTSVFIRCMTSFLRKLKPDFISLQITLNFYYDPHLSFCIGLLTVQPTKNPCKHFDRGEKRSVLFSSQSG